MNNNGLGTLFIFNLLSYHSSTRFGLSAAHHEVECIYVANGTCYTTQLNVSRPADSKLRSITSTICHIYTFYILMMGC
jgi:hypothetical protein